MHPIILSFVSLLASTSAPTTAPAPKAEGHCFVVRSLVQGSGTVKTFDHASDMGKVGVCK